MSPSTYFFHTYFFSHIQYVDFDDLYYYMMSMKKFL